MPTKKTAAPKKTVPYLNAKPPKKRVKKGEEGLFIRRSGSNMLEVHLPTRFLTDDEIDRLANKYDGLTVTQDHDAKQINIELPTKDGAKKLFAAAFTEDGFEAVIFDDVVADSAFWVDQDESQALAESIAKS